MWRYVSRRAAQRETAVVQNQRVRPELHDADGAAQILADLDIMCRAVIAQLQRDAGNDDNALREMYGTAFNAHPGHARCVSIARLVAERYTSDALFENHPNTTRNTSYVQDKGTAIAICLREKSSGKHYLHRLQVIQFVTLHELTHIGSKLQHHPPGFWKNFKVVLQAAQRAGYHFPDYSKEPAPYCGIQVSYNPYYHTDLDLDIEHDNDY